MQHTSYFIENIILSSSESKIVSELTCQSSERNISQKNLYTHSVTHVLEPIYILLALHTGTCINRPWRWAGWPIWFCGSTQEPALATANTGNIRGRVWKKGGWVQSGASPTRVQLGWHFLASDRQRYHWTGRLVPSYVRPSEVPLTGRLVLSYVWSSEVPLDW